MHDVCDSVTFFPNTSHMDTGTSFRLMSIRPRQEFGDIQNLFSIAAIPIDGTFYPRLFELPRIGVIFDDAMEPVWEPSLFLADTAIRSRSVTGDTVRTYGEALLPWLEYLKSRGRDLSQATEEDLGIYRASISHKKVGNNNEYYASATVNLRVVVPALFHEWAQQKAVLESPLGLYLQRNPAVTQFHRLNVSARNRRAVATVRTQKVIRRLPTALSMEQISRILRVTPMPQRLMLKWCLATGIRRMEVTNLELKDLPLPEAVATSPDGFYRMQMVRKGGREHTVHVPSRLIEETNWFVLVERPKPSSIDARNKVFLNTSGKPVSKQTLTRTFRTSADSIGSAATLHHLRHTFAVHVLSTLERKHREGEELNSIKTLQVLLGHASVVSTEIYLQAMQTSSDAVMEALDYLYGADL